MLRASSYRIHYEDSLANNKHIVIQSVVFKSSSVRRLFISGLCIFLFISCSADRQLRSKEEISYDDEQQKLMTLLSQEDLDEQSRFAAMNQLAANMRAAGRKNDLILFLTTYAEKNPDDPFNSYWLLMVAHTYLEDGAVPVAEYYFDRILENYGDLTVKGTSVHLMCLQNLINISSSPDQQISYYTQLITRFPDDIDLSVAYFKLGQLYEKQGEWELAIKTYSQFISRPDAYLVQVPSIPDAYDYAKKLIDFNNSPKDWTFESLDALVTAVKKAIRTYNYAELEKYRAKVNFFAMSWKQDATDTNSEANFTMSNFMMGNRIRFNDELDETSNPQEAYLRTWGWNQYISVWYLCFRKVNFPLDPDIHGRWEWAGIYFGEKV